MKKVYISYKVKRRGRVFKQIKKSKQKQPMTGTIKTLTDRGFGFIACEGEEKDIFFHLKNLQGVTFEELRVGDAVTFEIVDGDKGRSATEVKRV